MAKRKHGLQLRRRCRSSGPVPLDEARGAHGYGLGRLARDERGHTAGIHRIHRASIASSRLGPVLLVGARFIQGDALERLRELPDATVDLVFSSPPFLGLRSYLPEGHADKAREIGSEPTPDVFIDVLLDITGAGVPAPLATPHGSLCSRTR